LQNYKKNFQFEIHEQQNVATKWGWVSCFGFPVILAD